MEKEERRSRLILFIAFLCTLTSVGLLAGALGSDDWVNSNLIYDNPNSANTPAVITNGAATYHGLFKGKADITGQVVRESYDIKIDCDFSTRVCRYDAIDRLTGRQLLMSFNSAYEQSMSISEKCRQTSQAQGILERPAEINFWIWLATLIFVALAILFALIAAVFTMINVIYVPISDIVGVRGIYVWNGVASHKMFYITGLCTTVAICAWSGLYYSHLQYNIIPARLLQNSLTTCGLSQQGTAIWLCLAALLIFLLNIVLIRFRRGFVRNRQRAKSYTKGEQITLY